jgi:hypothetical protein
MEKQKKLNLKDFVYEFWNKRSYLTTTNVRISKPMYELGLARKSLQMLITKGNSCN